MIYMSVVQLLLYICCIEYSNLDTRITLSLLRMNFTALPLNDMLQCTSVVFLQRFFKPCTNSVLEFNTGWTWKLWFERIPQSEDSLIIAHFGLRAVCVLPAVSAETWYRLFQVPPQSRQCILFHEKFTQVLQKSSLRNSTIKSTQNILNCLLKSITAKCQFDNITVTSANYPKLNQHKRRRQTGVHCKLAHLNKLNQWKNTAKNSFILTKPWPWVTGAKY